MQIKDTCPITVYGNIWRYKIGRNTIVIYDPEGNKYFPKFTDIIDESLITGKETPLDKIKLFREYMNNNSNRYVIGKKIPLIIGAGLDVNNVAEQLPFADGAIVGSCFKLYKRTTEMIRQDLVKEFMNEVKKVRLDV